MEHTTYPTQNLSKSIQKTNLSEMNCFELGDGYSSIIIFYYRAFVGINPLMPVCMYACIIDDVFFFLLILLAHRWSRRAKSPKGDYLTTAVTLP